MIFTGAALPSSYDYSEVARSVMIAIAASYAGLDLAGRVTAAKGQVRLAWLSGGAIAMGIGIFEMHFKAMLALHLPVPIKYAWPTVLAALLMAILASAVALYVASGQKMGAAEALAGSFIMGGGIAGLHYLLMAAMRMSAITRFSPLLVTCSILLAILFSLIALLMAFGLREETRRTVPRRIGSAFVMGGAISAMHYTGMAAASFIPAPPPDLSYAVSVSPIGNSGVVTVTLIVIVAAIVTSSVDRRAAAEVTAALEEAQGKLAHVTRTQAMGELAAAIAHEVNQPLTAIVTNGNFCLRSLEAATSNPDEIRAAIIEIVNDGNRASAVISRIRGLLTKGTPRRTELDIARIIGDVTILLRHEVTRNRVFLRTDFAADLPRMSGDPVQLQQVLINLVMNAIEALRTSTHGKREILIRSASNPDAVLVQVQDSGPGVAPELAGRIFEPFFTTKAEGIGMGLSICRSIVESHGGQLSLLPTPQGSLFQFTLPVPRND
jgi:two-component system, sensor histidine kinase and response regulator